MSQSRQLTTTTLGKGWQSNTMTIANGLRRAHIVAKPKLPRGSLRVSRALMRLNFKHGGLMQIIQLANVPDEIKAKAQELWPESYEKDLIEYKRLEDGEDGALEWLLEENLNDDFAHLYKDGDKWEVAYL